MSSLLPLLCQGLSYETRSQSLYTLNISTGFSVAINSQTNTFQDYVNGLAYHPQENYLYVVGQNYHNPGYIIRVGAGGLWQNTSWVIPQTNPTGTSATSMTIADIDINLQYWLSYDNGNGYVQVDLNSASSTYGQVVANGTTTGRSSNLVSDWAYLPAYPGRLYALGQVSNSGVYSTRLMYFDTSTKAWTVVFWFISVNGGTSATGVAGQAQWGAVYTALDGYVYGLENNSGQIWKFKVDSPTANDAIFVSNGPTGGNNDGAKCMINAL